jgi:hypothetical protein
MSDFSENDFQEVNQQNLFHSIFFFLLGGDAVFLVASSILLFLLEDPLKPPSSLSVDNVRERRVCTLWFCLSTLLSLFFLGEARSGFEGHWTLLPNLPCPTRITRPPVERRER